MGRATTTAKQNADSIEHMAALFEQHAVSLRQAATMLRAEPVIPEIVVENEASRLKAIEGAAAWVSAASKAAFAERISIAQRGVRQSGSTGSKSPKR